MWPQWKVKVKKTILVEVPMTWCFIDLAFQKLADNFFMERSSHRRCSVKKDVLRNFKDFTGKHLCWSLSLIKLHVCNHLIWGTSVNEFLNGSLWSIFSMNLRNVVEMLAPGEIKVQWCRFENLLLCLCSYKSSTFGISHLKICKILKKEVSLLLTLNIFHTLF